MLGSTLGMPLLMVVCVSGAWEQDCFSFLSSFICSFIHPFISTLTLTELPLGVRPGHSRQILIWPLPSENSPSGGFSATFLKLSINLAQIILCLETCPMQGRMSGSIPGFNPLDASGIPSSHETKNVFRHWQVPWGASPLVESYWSSATTGLHRCVAVYLRTSY